MVFFTGNSKRQYTFSLLLVSTVSIFFLLFRDFIDYRVVGFAYLVVVSVLAIFCEIKPVLLGAVLSALLLNFLFIKPYYTLHIDSAQDALLLLMFFIIALINAVLTHRFKVMQRIIQIKETKANTLKLYNTLLDSLSHELRTPIAAVIGSIDILKQENVTLSDATKQNLYNEIEKASVKLNYQVENLLNMSRLESGYIQPKPDWCDVNEVLHRVINRLSDELYFHKIEFQPEDNLPLFRLDIGLTEQIVYNLLCNAAQHTPKGSVIRISAQYDVDTDYDSHLNLIQKCIIKISDNGYGFPENERDKAFDKFFRSKTSKTGGTGLGLSIVKGFVQSMNGTITLRNNAEGGALFEIIIPTECLSVKAISND